MVLTAEQQAELRAKKALETGDASFKPRGKANKAIFVKMKEEFDKKAKEINSHTSSEADRIIAATATAVLEVIGKHTQPNPGQTRMAAVMAGPSTAVKVLNSILSDEGIECKGTKTDKADVLANTIPVHRLVKLLEEHKNCAMSKAKPEVKSEAKAEAVEPSAKRAKTSSSSSAYSSYSSSSDHAEDHSPTVEEVKNEEDVADDKEIVEGVEIKKHSHVPPPSQDGHGTTDSDLPVASTTAESLAPSKAEDGEADKAENLPLALERPLYVRMDKRDIALLASTRCC